MDLLYTSSSINKDGYVNMFEVLEKHRFASFKLISKDFSPPTYMHKHARHSSDVWKAALKSDRVQWIIRQIVRNENKSEEEVLKEAETILKELAYTDHMSLVRLFGFSLYHIYKAIYKDGVFINVEAAEKIRKTFIHHPIVFMPSHRSYMDFLMLSFVCFYLDLPLPAIAAGMDFKSMAVISTILRSSGAFFMRRSFGSDRLYWALFTEYVHTILINGDRPMEFFIEGTRSRVGKSLNPKFGLLSVISEPYLKAQTFDVIIVPVSLSYDRLLEEKLYAYELLGVPKPKESTSGVFKAATILQENYGSVHLHFGETLSLREYFGSHLDRAVHACYPRYMLKLSDEEQMSMKILAYKILLKQQKYMSCSPFTAIAAILCLHPNGIKMSVLVEELMWLKLVLSQCNVRMLWPVGKMSDIVYQYLYRYKHLVNMSDLNDPSSDTNDKWIIIAVSQAQFSKKRSLSMIDHTIQDDAASHLMLVNYRNQLLCYFVRPALIALCLDKLTSEKELLSFTKEELLPDFTFLVQLMKREFIFEPNQLKNDLVAGLQVLVKCGVLTETKGTFCHVESCSDHLLSFLRLTFTPFLASYWMCCQYIVGAGNVHDHSKINERVSQAFIGMIAQCKYPNLHRRNCL